MKIAFDLDSVCVNTVDAIIEYINERVPVNLKVDDITSYNIESALPEQFQWIVDAGFRDSKMWKKVKLLPRCAEIMEKLYKEGYEIWFATSSLPENMRKKIKHLARNMQFFPEHYVWQHTINIQDKYLLNVDVLVDDCLKHAIHPDRLYWSIIMDYPWNRLSEPVERTVRAYDWDWIYEKIHLIDNILKESIR